MEIYELIMELVVIYFLRIWKLCFSLVVSDNNEA